jgi:hypothetical protein
MYSFLFTIIYIASDDDLKWTSNQWPRQARLNRYSGSDKVVLSISPGGGVIINEPLVCHALVGVETEVHSVSTESQELVLFH